jgi:hypothetical protein
LAYDDHRVDVLPAIIKSTIVLLLINYVMSNQENASTSHLDWRALAQTCSGRAKQRTERPASRADLGSS